jgi:hypothetical protein
MTMAGDMWFDGFASPWLAEVAPQVFSTLRPTPILELGALLSLRPDGGGLGASTGSPRCGRGCSRSGGARLMVAGLIAFRSSFPPYGCRSGWSSRRWARGSSARIGRERSGNVAVTTVPPSADVRRRAVRRGPPPVGEALQPVPRPGSAPPTPSSVIVISTSAAAPQANRRRRRPRVLRHVGHASDATK